MLANGRALRSRLLTKVGWVSTAAGVSATADCGPFPRVAKRGERPAVPRSAALRARPPSVGNAWRRQKPRYRLVPGAVSQLLSVTEATSAMVSLIAAAATLASRCDTDPVPGIGRIEGDRASNQASTICRVVAS